jgi:predicted ArsR family transcriptional regulator
LPVLDADPDMSSNHALWQPSRARVFELLADLKRPAKTTELAARLDMHPNGVRIHLERLQDAQLIARTRIQGPRGRPADAWTVAPGARPGGRAPRAYADLSRWLARAIDERSTSLSGLERTGREIGRELAPSDGAAGVEAVERALAALGFAPSVQTRQGDRLTIRLGNCPYRDVARENQPAICVLHKGITRGLLDALASGTTLKRFVPHEPAKAGCLLELRGAAPASRSSHSRHS